MRTLLKTDSEVMAGVVTFRNAKCERIRSLTCRTQVISPERLQVLCLSPDRTYDSLLRWRGARCAGKTGFFLVGPEVLRVLFSTSEDESAPDVPRRQCRPNGHERR